MTKKVTIYDLSEKLNISPASVSRALNNKSGVSKKTKTMVQRAAFEINFVPNKYAVALQNRTTIKKVTIYDLSNKLRISPASVSRALNNRSGISKKTKAIVLKAASEINFVPNKHALALQNGNITRE